MVVGIVGALTSGWNSPVRGWLWLALVMFLMMWAVTPTIFWPMIHQLYGTAIGASPPPTPSPLARLGFIPRLLDRDRFHRICASAKFPCTRAQDLTN
jgi:hypothetical protein